MASPFSRESAKRISIKNIRTLFNNSQYPQMIDRGLLKPEYVRDKHLPEPALVHEPECTYSQFIRYYDADGTWLVEVHQYFRSKDNSIGGSGKPDPKRLRIGNKVFIADKSIA